MSRNLGDALGGWILEKDYFLPFFLKKKKRFIVISIFCAYLGTTVE